MANGLELHSEAVPPKCLEPEDDEGGGGDRTAEHYAKRSESLIPVPGGGQLLLHKIQLVHDLSEVIAGLGGLPEGKAVGVEVIGHVTYTRPHVRLRTGRPVSQYAGSEGCAGLPGAGPHA